jgi:perosamine synthetase
MEEIMDVAEEFHLKVIEDATEALGSRFFSGRYAGKYAGTIGDFGAYSFNGNKIITTGGGGAVTARDAGAVEHMRYISTQAKDDPHYYIHNEIGFNYRMTNLQAALGVAQLEELPKFIRRKQQNYRLYEEQFLDFPLGKLLPFCRGTDSNHWFYSLEIAMDQIHASLRDIITALQERGVQTRAIWGLIHEQLPYRGAIAYQMERAPYYSSCIINLPCSTQITEEEICYVAEQVRDVLEGEKL